jgi:multicomponent K+:H+ antiporter subunit G
MLLIAEAAVSLLLVTGAFFLFAGSLGLAKLPDLLRRLHGPTKATTLGIGGVLMASMLYFLAFEGDPSVHEVLITVFLFLTAPVSAQMIAKAHILRGADLRGMLPPTGRPGGWATLDEAAAAARSETAGTADAE